jgi:hypothetical protein
VGRVSSNPAHAFQGRSQIIDIGGVPHIAFLEVDKSFFPERTFVYVKYWNGANWVLKERSAEYRFKQQHHSRLGCHRQRWY